MEKNDQNKGEQDDIANLQLNFTLKRYIVEEHKPTMVYCVRFCDVHPSYYSYFGSVGGNCVSIYHINDDNNVRLVQAYLDEDTEEILYACTWCSTSISPVLLVVAGLRGILKCINCITYEIETVLLGHGNAVNDLRVHPIQNSILLSASKDESIRLWNVETGVCIAVFSGEKGHRDEILSIDPHPLGNCFCSSGMDTSIKIWGLDDERLNHAIKSSFVSSRRKGNLPFEPLVVHAPLFSTTQVHSDYVDSVRWFGNCILSKSTKNRIALWAPDSDRYKGAPLILKEYKILESNLWFVRMDICIPLDILAVGNKDGRVFIYPLSSMITDSTKVIKKRGVRKIIYPSISETNGTSTSPSSSSYPTNSSSSTSSSTATATAAEYEYSSVSSRNEISEPYEYDHPSLASAVLSHPRCQSTIRQVAFHPLGKNIIYSCDDGSISVWAITSDQK